MVPCANHLLRGRYQPHHLPHTNTLVIKTNIQWWTIGKILVDTGSLANIVFSSTFDRMNIDMKLLRPAEITLISFRGKRVNALGTILLLVSFGDLTYLRTENITLDIVEMNYPYLTIFSMGFTNKFETVVHQLFLCVKSLQQKG